MYDRTTPENIKSLKKGNIFVFGSNKAGRHGAGAAKLAKDKFEAEYGVGEGLTGRAYAFPTLDENFEKLDLKEIKKSVNKLNKCAKENSFKIFLLTKVGCGLAGYKEDEIKKLFSDMELNIIKPRGWK